MFRQLLALKRPIDALGKATSKPSADDNSDDVEKRSSERVPAAALGESPSSAILEESLETEATAAAIEGSRSAAKEQSKKKSSPEPQKRPQPIPAALTCTTSATSDQGNDTFIAKPREQVQEKTEQGPNQVKTGDPKQTGQDAVQVVSLPMCNFVDAEGKNRQVLLVRGSEETFL